MLLGDWVSQDGTPHRAHEVINMDLREAHRLRDQGLITFLTDYDARAVATREQPRTAARATGKRGPKGGGNRKQRARK